MHIAIFDAYQGVMAPDGIPISLGEALSQHKNVDAFNEIFNSSVNVFSLVPEKIK